jgi:hypothetical protein
MRMSQRQSGTQRPGTNLDARKTRTTEVSRLIGETRHGQTSRTILVTQQSPTNHCPVGNQREEVSQTAKVTRSQAANQMSSETQYSKVNQTKSIGRSNTMARKRVVNPQKPR